MGGRVNYNWNENFSEIASCSNLNEMICSAVDISDVTMRMFEMNTTVTKTRWERELKWTFAVGFVVLFNSTATGISLSSPDVLHIKKNCEMPACNETIFCDLWLNAKHFISLEIEFQPQQTQIFILERDNMLNSPVELSWLPQFSFPLCTHITPSPTSCEIFKFSFLDVSLIH